VVLRVEPFLIEQAYLQVAYGRGKLTQAGVTNPSAAIRGSLAVANAMMGITIPNTWRQVTMAESDLSERQRAVLQLARDGKTVPEVAAAMSITPSGVREHARRIRQAGIDITFTNGRRGRPGRQARPAASPPASGLAAPATGQSASADDALRRAVDAVRAERARLELRLGELEAEAADVRQAIAKLAAMVGEPEKV
jgi:hypothetical protein